MSEATVTFKGPCPKCPSSDAYATYSDGGGHCFSCGFHLNGMEDSDDDQGVDRAPAGVGGDSGGRPSQTVSGEFRSLPKRGISEETCRKFGYRVGNYRGGTVQIADYVRDGSVVAQKLRTPSKDFVIVGPNPKKLPLFGQHLWRDGGKRLVITEGEIDAMTVSQLQGNKWPVVSVPNGAQGASKTVAQEIEWIEQFEQVVFMFDMDEPGRAAAMECAALLTPGRALIASLPEKDANACHISGKSAAVIDAMWGAKAYRPDGIVDVASIAEAAAKPLAVGKSWPWEGMAPTYGRRRKELYGFGGGTGCGKSTVFKQVANHIIDSGEPVAMMMLEEPPAHTLKTMAGMKMGVRVHVPGVEYKPEAFRKVIDSFNDKVYFYDHFGATGWKVIKEKIRYLVLSLGIKDIFLDHLTALAASIDTDERKAIDAIMADLSSLTQELDCTIYYISHLSTPDGKSHEEGGRVLEKHFRGSRSIGYWTHFLFAIERDKQDVGGVTTFRILKDRYTGDANGVTFGLAYNRTTGLLEECELPTEGETSSPFAGSDY